MTPFIILAAYLIGVGVTHGVLDHKGYDGTRFDPDHTGDMVYMLLLSFLWPALVIYGVTRWLVNMGIGR